MNAILDLIKKYPPKKVEIFKLHNLAKRKYAILNKEYYHDEISNELIIEFNNKLKSIVTNSEIIEI